MTTGEVSALADRCEELLRYKDALLEMAVGYGLGTPASRGIITAMEHADALALRALANQEIDRG